MCALRRAVPAQPSLPRGRYSSSASAAEPATPLDGLLAALRLSLPLGGDARADAALLGQVADVDGIAALAARHRVRGLLVRGASRRQEDGAGGPLAALAASCLRNAAPSLTFQRASLQLSSLRRLALNLRERETPFLVLKGLPLAQRLYGDPFVREAGDIDLLVAPESFAKSREAVLATGFWPEMSFDETPARVRWAQRVRKEETFVRNDIRLELHRRVLGNPHYFDAPFAKFHERRAWVAIGGERYPTLPPDEELVYLMCHGAGHGWMQLKWLCDVALCLKGSDEAELARIAARCRQAGIGAVWNSALAACRALGVESSAGTADGRRGEAVARMLPEVWRSGRWPPLWRKVALRAALKPNLRFAAHELARLMVVPEDWRRVNLPDRLFFLYFFLRPWFHAVDALAGRWGRRAAPEPPRGRHRVLGTAGSAESDSHGRAANGRGRARIDLPLALRLEDLGLSLGNLRAALGSEQAFGKPVPWNDPATCRLGFYNPPIGKLIARKLAPRIGALVFRPGCVFANSFLWQYDRGSRQVPHVDRPPLDITMSIPITFDGVDAWPIHVRQPNGDVMDWPGRLGTALVVDGRWRPHWRDVFQGTRSVVMLLHWRAPAVLWPQFLDRDRRLLLRDGGLRRSDQADLLESGTALARSAMPQATPPRFKVVDLQARTLSDAADQVVLLAPLENELVLAFDRVKVTVAPGDGVAFAARDHCRIDWPNAPNAKGANKVLLGRGRHAYGPPALGH